MRSSLLAIWCIAHAAAAYAHVAAFDAGLSSASDC